jgi:hypothetical protein
MPFGFAKNVRQIQVFRIGRETPSNHFATKLRRNDSEFGADTPLHWLFGHREAGSFYHSEAKFLASES